MTYYSANHAVIAEMTEWRIESCPSVPHIFFNGTAGQKRKEPRHFNVVRLR